MSSSAAALREAAIAALNAGDVAKAETALRALVTAGEGNSEQTALLAKLVYNRAVAALQTEGHDVAERLLREAIAFAPALPEPRRGLVKLLFRRVTDDEAAGAWLAAAKSGWEIAALSPDPMSSFGNPMAALAQRFETQSRARTADQPVNAARLALAAWGLAGQGRTHYDTARAIFVHLGTGEFGAAADLGALQALLERDPSDLVALIGAANLHRRARRLHTAEVYYRTALAHWPENPFATARLAALLAEQGALETADALFQTVGARFGGVESVIRLSPAFLSSLPASPDQSNDFTAPTAGDFVVLAGGDAGYFHRFGDALANSLAKNARGCALHFHVAAADVEVATRVEAMRERLPDLPISITTEDVPAHLPPHLHKTFYACARFLQLPRLLAATGKPILLLDIDMVVLRDPKPLLARLDAEQADLALVQGETRDPWCSLWADTVLIAPTPRGLEYAGLVRDYIAHFIARGEAMWFLDQVALFAAFTAGFRDRPAPVMLGLPTDIQNTRTDLAYFWSLHMSQPNNAGGPETELYRRFQANAV